jgi:flagellar hook-associated protein 2
MFNFGVPAQNAEAFAVKYMQNAVDRLEAQKAGNSAAKAALTKLQGALSSFQTALLGLSGGSGVVRQSATLSDPSAGSATVGKGAQPGTYQFHVEKLASAHQVSYADVPAFAAAGAGTLTITRDDGSTFEVDLSSANADDDGNVTAAELARAINQAAGNEGAVSASIVTIDGRQQLVLTSGQSGEAGRISLDTSGVGSGALRDALSATPTEFSAASDAVFYLGGPGGTRIQQASNTFTGIDGVAVTFARGGGTSVSLTVALDSGGTKSAVQEFVNAYNELTKLIGDLAASGGEGKPAGPFSGDAAVRGLQQQLAELLRTQADGQRLSDYGIEVDRYGKLSLDGDRLDAMLAKNPEGLNTLFGSGADSVVSRMDTYLKTWTSSTDGHIKRRQESAQAIEQSLNKKEISLEAQYDRIYQRYLVQFTKVEQLQSQMQFTLDLLTSLPEFGGSKK